MNEQYFIPAMCIIVLVTSLLVSGCTTGFPNGATGTTTVPATITPGNPDRPDCGFTPCHGLELTMRAGYT